MSFKQSTSILSAVAISLISSLSWGESETSRRHLEYQIPPSWLIAFSEDGAKARLCSTCVVKEFRKVQHTKWKEYTVDVDIQRATELFVSKQSFDVIYMGLDLETGKLDYIDFGGYIGDH